MDFFARQSIARGRSWLLVAGFVVAMLGTALVLHVAVGGFSMLLGDTQSLAEPSAPALALIALAWLAVALGAVFRLLDVRAGATALARRFGAVEIDGMTREPKLRMLANVVAEVAVGACTEPPRLFLLPAEPAINAFVLGSPGERPVLVVTEGALDALARDELQGVVAHEIGHIVQGDLGLNMRLLVALGGLAALDEIGRLLVGRRAGEGPLHPGVAVGWLLRGIGGVGVLLGSLLRAALCRRREYLADATAVQLTRDPTALASALATIRDRGGRAALTRSVHVAELAHLCFGGSARPPWYRRPFASHPPLEARIDAIDRHVDVKRRRRAHSRGEGAANAPAGGCAEDAASARPPLSDRVQLLLHDAESCVAALLALFADEAPEARRDYLDAIAFAFGVGTGRRVETMRGALRGELEADRLGIVEHIGTTLVGAMREDKRQRLLLRLEHLLVAHGQLDLGRYATLQLLRRRLEVDFPRLERRADGAPAGRTRLRGFEQMSEEFALLLSLMVEASGAPASTLDREFERVLRCYTERALPRRSREERGIIAELEHAFRTLEAQPKAIRRAFVQHCIEIMHADGRAEPTERALIELFAASLDCAELLVRPRPAATAHGRGRGGR